MHTHSDGSIMRCPSADSRVMQGVTTEVTGNCGGSAAPRKGRDGKVTSVAAYMDGVDKAGIAVNHALLLGQGTLRSNVIGLTDRRPTREEMKQMLRALEEGLEQGAYGISTGLEYMPGRFTPTDEIVEMARVVARHGGLYASHIRDEEANLLEAITEAIEIGRRSGARVEVSHLKAGGRVNWNKQDKALELLETARRTGLDIMADAYPYTAYSTGLTIFLDDWARVGGTGRLLSRLKDPEQRARMRKSLAQKVPSDPGGYELIVITSLRTDELRPMIGKTVAEIAKALGVEPAEAMLHMIEKEKGRVGFIGHGMSAENVDKVLAHPMVMIGSDGSSMKPPKERGGSLPHPRSYGTFARVLGYYTRVQKILDLPTAVRKMTSMPADQLGLADRGRIAPSLKADMVVFDAEKVIDRATFKDPQRFPDGIHHVLVAGAAVVRDKQLTTSRPGGMLRKT
jgi:N-acyl-D-amino-acid deacylase